MNSSYGKVKSFRTKQNEHKQPNNFNAAKSKERKLFFLKMRINEMFSSFSIIES